MAFYAKCARSAGGAYMGYVPPGRNKPKRAHSDRAACALPSGLLGAWSLFPRLLGRNQVDLAARRLDGRQSTLGRVLDLEGDLLGREAFRTDQAHAILGAADDAGRHQGCGIDHALGVELARVDIGLDAVDADLVPILGVPGIEAALGHAHVKRHLAAFEAVDGYAGPGRLALAAATAGLADARADAAAD